MKDRHFNYVQDLTKYERQETWEVNIGGVGVGGTNPIRIQTMTDTSSKDTEATLDQMKRMILAGAEFIRVTVKGMSDAENLKNIAKGMEERGFTTPLIADIHFNPKLAEVAAKYVAKVRINPGNFYDKRAQFSRKIYSDEEYKIELQKIEEKFIPFLNHLKKTDTALRVGANHGSLSDRVMSRYGDTPSGMAESVLEYLRICRKANFNDVVVSIKSSNTRMMVYTVRLLNYKMRLEDMKYPVHLGVTEAGEGEDGRIKSAVGIGALLADGIGDTIRVSLTEPPEDEIPVAQKLAGYFTERINHPPIEPVFPVPIDFYDYKKYDTQAVVDIGGNNPAVVISGAESKTDRKPEYIYLGHKLVGKTLDTQYNYIIDERAWEQQEFDPRHVFPLYSSANNYLLSDKKSETLNFITVSNKNINPDYLNKISNRKDVVMILVTSHPNGFADQRAAFFKLMNAGCRVPVIIKRTYKENRIEDL